MASFIFDLDRTLIRTGDMLAWSAMQAESGQLVSASTYHERYRAYRAQHDGRASLSGFTSYLIDSLGLEPHRAQHLEWIHAQAATMDLSYPGARELLCRVGPRRAYILTKITPGDETLQRIKIRSAGLDTILPSSHIAVVPDKSEATLRDVFTRWGLQSETDSIVHVNDAPDELARCCAMFPEKSRGILFTDSPYATETAIRQARGVFPDIVAVPTFTELSALCLRIGMTPEGRPAGAERR